MAASHVQSHRAFDKVTLITGGSRGIGAACARVFVGAGAHVVICARGRESGLALAAKLEARGPGTCSFEACDVTKPDDIWHVVEKTVQLHGRLDCLLNNAGQHPDHRPIDQFSVEDFRGLLRTNLVSYFAACKYALPYLRQVHGNIINMSSLVGNIGQEWATTYAATKGGITALTKALAVDEARYGVRVNAVLPGRINTESFQALVQSYENPADVTEYNNSMQWLGRVGSTEEVAHACLFLASDDAGFITGIELLVTGGAELAYAAKHIGGYHVCPASASTL